MSASARFDDQNAIRAEQVRQLFGGSPTSLATIGILAMLLAHVQMQVVPTEAVWLWLFMIESVIVARALFYLAWLRLPARFPTPTWLRYFRIGTVATGVAWGLASFMIFPASDIPHQAILSFALAGVTAGAVSTYGIDLIAVLGYCIPLLLPLIWRLFTQNTHVGSTMAAMVVLFMMFVLASARRQQRNMLENIALRNEAEAGKNMLQQKESALELLSERLTALIEAIPDAIFFKDGKGRWLITNEPAKHLFKLHGFAWRGKTERELAEARPEFRTLHETCLIEDEEAWRSGKLTLFQEYVQGDDGRKHEFEVRKMPVFDSAGNRMALVVIGRDITERRAAEQELRIAAAVFEVQEGVVIVDVQDRILRVNRAFTLLTGFSHEEVIGQSPSILRSDRHDALFYQQMREKLQLDGVWQGEIWHRCKDGSTHPHWLTISAIKGGDGQVVSYIGTFSDITLYKEAEQEINKLAYFDQLTNLPNRRLLLDRLQQALVSSDRHRLYGAILFIDLDNFKTLNDTRGHDVGDQLLKEVGRRLEYCVRDEDTVARLGGDEFVVMLENLSAEASQAAIYAEIVGAKVKDVLNQPYHLDELEHHTSPSIGISLFLGNVETVEDLLKHADAAMYQAKQSGRNMICFFDPTMQTTLEARIRLEQELRQALPQQQLQLYFQPQVNVDRHLVGAEVLLRWKHPERGLVSPAEFIPVAEETGLIVQIGFWVMQMACTQLKKWENRPDLKHLRLAVNVSARQFRQADFVEQVERVLDLTGVNPGMLELELTESLVLDDVTDTIEKMQALKARGVSFSMDDFGTGHSSLAQLKRLPLNQVKIDQSFVRDIDMDANDAAIVQTIIAMTETLGLGVIAEGVETETQLEFLKRNGCPLFQGYLFGRPVPLETFEKNFVEA